MFDFHEDVILDNFQLEVSEALDTVIKNKRNFEIVSIRLGLQDGGYHTLRQIGNIYSLSGERIRQIELKAYKRLRITALSQIKKGNLQHPCVSLFKWLTQWVMPGDSNDILNIATLSLRLSSLPLTRTSSFISNICFGPSEAKIKAVSASTLIQQIRDNINELIRYEFQQKRLFNQLFKDTVWPEKTKKITQAEWKGIKPLRSVNSDGEGESGSFFSKKNNSLVEYESLLEYQFCDFLEKLESVSRYVQQPFQIPYKIGGMSKVYYPDFFVLLNDGRGIIVEIKVRSSMAQYINIMKWIGMKAFCEKYGFGFLIIEKFTSLLRYILSTVEEKKRNSLLEILDKGPVNWNSFKKIREGLNISWSDLNSIILQNNLKLTFNPFSLMKSDDDFSYLVNQNISFKNNIESIKNNDLEGYLNKKTLKFNANKNKKKTTNIGGRWTEEEERKLIDLFKSDKYSIKELASIHGRTSGGISARLKKLGLIQE